MNPAIQVSQVSKTFIIPHEVRDTLKESLVRIFRRKTYEKFEALQDISFGINHGEFLGIVGKNGSGKSTLLKILAGIYKPNKGNVQVAGKIAPFLELGIGFQQELTARENITVNATLLGLTKKEIREKFDKIVEFAEIENFLDLKIKNFSSGMKARLAFAIAKEADADIYLCDEILAVGDEAFQQKCLAVFRKWKQEGKTIVLVSHNSAIVKELCSRVMLIEDGTIVLDGEPQEVVDNYHNTLKVH